MEQSLVRIILHLSTHGTSQTSGWLWLIISRPLLSQSTLNPTRVTVYRDLMFYQTDMSLGVNILIMFMLPDLALSILYKYVRLTSINLQNKILKNPVFKSTIFFYMLINIWNIWTLTINFKIFGPLLKKLPIRSLLIIFFEV